MLTNNVIPDNWHIVQTGNFGGIADADVLWRPDDGRLHNWDLGRGVINADIAVADIPANWKIVGHTLGLV